jgi:hypothetical protein
VKLAELRKLHDDASTMMGALGQVIALSAAIDAALTAEGRNALWGVAFRTTGQAQQAKCKSLLDTLAAKTADVGDI